MSKSALLIVSLVPSTNSLPYCRCRSCMLNIVSSWQISNKDEEALYVIGQSAEERIVGKFE